MSTALVGFLGVIAGGVLTGCVQAAIAWRDRSRTARVSARLIYMHLTWALQAIDSLLEDESWNPHIDWERFVAVWEGRSEGLATTISTKEFLAVSAAFVGLENLSLIRTDDLADAKPDSRRRYPAASQATCEENAPHYRSLVEAALHIVHRASFTYRERRGGKADAGTAWIASLATTGDDPDNDSQPEQHEES